MSGTPEEAVGVKMHVYAREKRQGEINEAILVIGKRRRAPVNQVVGQNAMGPLLPKAKKPQAVARVRRPKPVPAAPVDRGDVTQPKVRKVRQQVRVFFGVGARDATPEPVARWRRHRRLRRRPRARQRGAVTI